MAASPELAQAIRDSAERLGINPSDLATAISYETSGTFDPWKAGPTTQWGQHRGLLQWGEPQRQKYGVTQDMSVADQMKAAERYLTDAGVKPGHGLLDVYSAINAGRVGLYDRSDANNGGAPGNVADKVASMAGHRMRANSLLGLENGPMPAGGAPAAPAGAAPMSMAPTGAPGDDSLMSALQGLRAIPAAQQQPEGQQQMGFQLDPIRYVSPAGLGKARALARAMSSRSLG